MLRKQHILTIGFAGEQDALASQLLLLSFRAVPAKSLEDALGALDASRAPIHAALFPTPHPFGELAGDLRRLRAAAPEKRLRFAVVGSRPDEDGLTDLRRAGVEFALFTPYAENELRFVANAVLRGRAEEEMRQTRRVPTNLLARVFSGAGEKAAVVYDLSEGGVFLETHRPTARGGRVRVELPLPGGVETFEARVVSNNVLGNLRRTNLPLGMGVQFLNLTAVQRELLRRYVDEEARDVRL